MIIHRDIEQGTEAWHQLRLGIPTASEFDKIITAGGKPSTQAEAYANRLLAEIIVGHPVETFKKTPWMDRGNALEGEAAAYYEMITEIETEKVTFVTDDERTIGASPDRLVGDDGLVEFKCPAPHTQIEYILGGRLDKEYWPQIQGQLYTTNREWVDLVSYYPEMRKPVVIRVERDEPYITTMSGLLVKFTANLAAKKQRLIELGHLEAA
jgi:putative phage-type endonuclease